MADVALDGAYVQGLFALPVYGVEGVYLYGVAQLGGGAVGLYIPDVGRVYLGVFLWFYNPELSVVLTLPQ